MTGIYYHDYHLYTGNWGMEYMAPYNRLPVINFGNLFDYTAIRVSNQSDHILFIFKDNILNEIDMKSLGITYGMGKVKATERPDTILLYFFDFNQSKDPEVRYILYDLNTRESYVRSRKIVY